MDMQNMIKDYTDWLNKEFIVNRVGEYYELNTPYLDRYNDHLQIYVKQNPNGSFLLTDDGYILQNLRLSGVLLSRSPKRREMLSRIANNFGISVNNECLEVQATKSTYPQKNICLFRRC